MGKHSLLFWRVSIAIFMCKLLLAYMVPLTGDEAYFAIWGQNPALGYYDHPPMIGWILYLLEQINSSVFFIRLPAVIFSSLIGVIIYVFLQRNNQEKAAWIGLFYAVSPLNIFNVIITTDTPLMLFSFLSAIFLYFGVTKERYGFYAAAGIFLGLAFLSKYFAGLLGIAFAIYFLVSEKSKSKTIGASIMFISIVPFVAFNLYWNYLNLYPNIMFNMVNRSVGKEEFSIMKGVGFLAMQLLFITPPIAYYALKTPRPLLIAKIKTIWRDFPLFFCSWIVPLLIFALISCKKVVGIHWLLSFYPFMYIFISNAVSLDKLKRSTKFMTAFSFSIVLIIVAIVSLIFVRPQILQENRHYSSIILATHTAEIAADLYPDNKDFSFAATSYVNASILQYTLGDPVIVFGKGSHHARQDDIYTDFRKLSGKNIAILVSSAPDQNAYTLFFDRVEIEKTAIKSADFWIIKGYDFKYENYQKSVLTAIKEKYYNLPQFLPLHKGGDTFLDRYGNIQTNLTEEQR
ncbi:hypothetical protein FACS189487_07290 [Campylobacterota bacterium]|nr:hypothetical protein FACS189487_07290 [Campylobacterota bacterium]